MTYDPLDYWPASCFRTPRHCAICLRMEHTSDCPCREPEQVERLVAPPEEPPAEPGLGPMVEQPDLWSDRKDLT